MSVSNSSASQPWPLISSRYPEPTVAITASPSTERRRETYFIAERDAAFGESPSAHNASTIESVLTTRPRSDNQQREQPPLLRTAERHGVAVPLDLDLAQHPEPHRRLSSRPRTYADRGSSHSQFVDNGSIVHELSTGRSTVLSTGSDRPSDPARHLRWALRTA